MKNRKPPVWRPAHQQTPEQRRAEWAARRKALDAAAGIVRPSAAERGYDTAWFRLRTAILRDEPMCRHCAARGIETRAQVVDHHIPIRDRPDLRLEPSNLVPMCRPCHAAKSVRHDGWFGAARRPR